MTNAELLAKIKVEIDKLYGEYKNKFHQCGDQYHLGLIDGLDMAERVLDTIESEKPVPNDLEEAAREFAKDAYPDKHNLVWMFKRGAKWQADHTPLPEDTVLFNKGVEEGRRLAEEEQADLFTIVALDAAQRAKIKIMEDFPKWRKIKAGERLPCPAYVWAIAYDNYPDCFEGRLMPNIQGVKVGRDTWYLPVDVIHNLPKED